MGGEQAASVLATVMRDNIEASGKEWSAEEEAAFKVSLTQLQGILRFGYVQRLFCFV